MATHSDQRMLKQLLRPILLWLIVIGVSSVMHLMVYCYQVGQAHKQQREAEEAIENIGRIFHGINR